MPHPKDTPLEEWPRGWLVLEVGNILNIPLYIMMHDHEKKEKGYPITIDEMKNFIKKHREQS